MLVIHISTVRVSFLHPTTHDDNATLSGKITAWLGFNVLPHCKTIPREMQATFTSACEDRPIWWENITCDWDCTYLSRYCVRRTYAIQAESSPRMWTVGLRMLVLTGLLFFNTEIQTYKHWHCVHIHSHVQQSFQRYTSKETSGFVHTNMYKWLEGFSIKQNFIV